MSLASVPMVLNQLATVTPAVDTTLAFIDANTYPYLKLRMNNEDMVNISPNQLRYWMISAQKWFRKEPWRLHYFYQMRDTVDQGVDRSITGL